MFYDDAKRQLLGEKLSNRVSERGLNSFLDLYYLLKYGPGADEEWPNVMDALSVPETYFWREMAQVHNFVNEILPKYATAYPDRKLRLWCAACATGEEPLSIAMALNEAGWFRHHPLEIVATDASPAAIQKARSGVYRERSFRSLPAELREKYFIEVPGGQQIRSELSAKVTWGLANLIDAETVRRFANSQFVFCRNVFIYFSQPAIRQTVDLFARNMERPGYLFVGASESLLRLTNDFELQDAGEAFVYCLP